RHRHCSAAMELAAIRVSGRRSGEGLRAGGGGRDGVGWSSPTRGLRTGMSRSARTSDELEGLGTRATRREGPWHASMLPLVYDELRALAARQLSAQRPDHTLQPTALINEAYLRLAGQAYESWEDRSEFILVAATVMRRVL